MRRGLYFLLAIAITGGIGFAQQPAPAGDPKAPAKLEVGESAPNFEVTGIDGEKFSLEQKLENGKHIVLMFSRAHW